MAAVLTGLLVVGSLDAMSDDTSRPPVTTDLASPTKLDYLVLASIADAPHLLTIAAYYSTAEPRAAARTDGMTKSAAPTSEMHSD